MALDLLKGAAQGIAAKSLKKVAGNLPGLLGFNKGRGGNTSDTAPLSQTKFSTKNYSFPLDVEGPPGTGNQGHYIMFFINQQQDAKLSFGNPDTQNKGAKSVVEAKSQAKIPEYIKNLDGSRTKNNGGAASQLIGEYLGDDAASVFQSGVKTRGSTVSVTRAPTIRMDTAITLYMPPQVQVSYAAEYVDTEIGAATAIAGEAIGEIANNLTLEQFKQSAGKAVAPLASELGEGAVRQLAKTADFIPGIEGALEVFDMKRGSIKAPRMELAFKGIGKRSFQYTFKMIPKSQAEADEIRKIVFAFKSNMLPEFSDGNRAGRRLRVPNTFDIQYMYNGAQNNFLHKISTCVCENVQVSYGGDRYRTFEAVDGDGAPPVETDITLQFKELEIITRERVFEGF